MTSHGSTINCETNPEGYITDLPFSAVKRQETVGDILVKLDNLPATATVVFELEKIIIVSQQHSSFTIARESDRLITEKVIYKSVTTVYGKMVHVYAGLNQPLIVLLKSHNVPTNAEHVRLKYKGEFVSQSASRPAMNIYHLCQLLYR